MKYQHPVIGSLLLLPLSITAYAEQVEKLDTVVVTASRTEQSIQDVLAPITVITRQDIDRINPSDFTELLKKVPGLQISSNGGVGSNASIFLRGAAGTQTLVLMNGQRIGSATTGTTPVQFISPEQIERIEIVRGNRAAQWGADAIGGVINIITRQAEKQRLSIKAGYGSFASRDLNVNFSNKTEKSSIQFSGRHQDRNGFDFTTKEDSTDSDRDGYKNNSGSLNLQTRLNKRTNGFLNAYHSEGRVNFDNSGSFPYSDFVNQNIQGGINLDVTENIQSVLTLGTSKDFLETPSYSSEIETKRRIANFQNNIQWQGSQYLSVGLDWYQDRVNKNGDNYEQTKRTNSAVYIQNQSDYENFDLQIGLRDDNNSAYGSKTTGNIALGLELDTDSRVIFAYSTGFRAPTFNELFWPNYGNPDLKPEQSKNAEVTLEKSWSNSSLQVSIFKNKVEDLISAGSNINAADLKGVEATWLVDFGSLSVNSNVTALSPKDSNTDKVLRRRARQLFSVDADYAFGKHSVGASVQGQSHSWDDAANTERLAGFAVVDLRSSYFFSKEIKLGIKINNLLDKEYSTASFKKYGDPTRYFYLGEPRGIYFDISWTPAS